MLIVDERKGARIEIKVVSNFPSNYYKNNNKIVNY
jgi:hypothetical protein